MLRQTGGQNQSRTSPDKTRSKGRGEGKIPNFKQYQTKLKTNGDQKQLKQNSTNRRELAKNKTHQGRG